MMLKHQQTKVNIGNLHICEIYFKAYMLRFFFSFLSLKYQKQLTMCCLNNLSDKMQKT